MLIKDRIYGSFEINEPVLIELINSKPVQRLKNIEQFGVPQNLYCKKCPGYSRYEHSIGVMLLIRKLGGSVEEQVAGLLHDVSHTAFSHVIDWVLNSSTKENFQDSIHEKFIHDTEIPFILEKHGFDIKRITDYKHFTLLERDIPNVCADRFDYSIREFAMWACPDVVEYCIDSLINIDGMMIFNSKEAARTFGLGYLKCQKEHWNSVDGASRYHLFSGVLKLALEKKIIVFDDFYTDDNTVMKKIRDANDETINRILKLLEGTIDYNSFNGPETIVRKKFRYVDPEYLDNGVIKRLSDVDENYRRMLDDFRTFNEEGIVVRIGDV